MKTARTVMLAAVFILFYCGSSYSLEYAGEAEKEKSHPYLEGLQLHYSDNTPMRFNTEIYLSEKYVKIYNKRFKERTLKYGRKYKAAQKVCTRAELTPTEIMYYIDNGCKVLYVYFPYSENNLKRNELFDSIANRIKAYNQIKCGKRFVSGLAGDPYDALTIDGRIIIGVNVLKSPPPPKPLSDMVYDK